MTSEYNGDEIKDASFPVEFDADSSALDMYGVWVKSGPRDASSSSVDGISIAEGSEPAQETLDEYLDLSDLPDLPDFPTQDEARFTELAEDVDGPEASFEDITIESASFDDSEAIVDTLSLDESPLIQDEGVVVSETDFIAPDIASDVSDVSDDLDISFEDLSFEDSSIEQSQLEIPTFTEESPDVVNQGSVDVLSDESPDVVLDSAQSVDDSSFDDMDIDIESFETNTLGDSESLPSDDDFSSFLDDLNTSGPPPKASDSSISAPAGDDLGLDDFINQFNESGGAPEEVRDKLFEDSDPVEIDLDFDESFIEDAEKIKATGSLVSGHEFHNSEFGVELIDETNQQDGSRDDSFDEMFNMVEDVSASSFMDSVATISGSEDPSMEIASEFDDILASLDSAPVSPTTIKSAKPVQQAKVFDLSVMDEDDSGETQTSSAPESSSDDDDFTISLDIDANAAEVLTPSSNGMEPAMATLELDEMAASDTLHADEFSVIDDIQVEDITEEPSSFDEELVDLEEKLDILPIKDYNEQSIAREFTENPADESLVDVDFDDISAVVQDLSEDMPESGEDAVVSNDKSTELLMVIAEELSSIKQELSTLKNELAGIKNTALPSEPQQAADTEIIDNSGFFSDDDTDETIALTGDELNNILITADFTEEKTAEIPEQGLDSTEIDVTSGFIDEPPATEDDLLFQDSEPFDEGLAEPEIPETLPDSIFDVSPLDSPASIEPSHVNSLDEDISYLEGSDSVEPDLDNVAIDEPELEIIDFNDEKLEEPILDEFTIDLRGIESALQDEQSKGLDDIDESSIPHELDISLEEDFSSSPMEAPADAPELDDTTTIATDASFDKAPSEKAPIRQASLPVELKEEIKSVLSYMDQLLESLPEEKIEEFARSEHFEVYKKLFEELGIS